VSVAVRCVEPALCNLSDFKRRNAGFFNTCFSAGHRGDCRAPPPREHFVVEQTLELPRLGAVSIIMKEMAFGKTALAEASKGTSGGKSGPYAMWGSAPHTSNMD